MPPRKQIEEDVILDSAFEMTRASGFDSITARSLAASLHCSTQPIYQAFADMKALEKAVAQKSFRFMLDQIHAAANADSLPRDLAFVLQYIHFALNETHLFRVIARNGLFAADTAATADNVPRIDPKLLIFANGIVFMSAFQSLQLSWDEIRRLVLAAYADFRRERV